MQRKISFFGAVVVCLLAVGCGPPDAEELGQLTQESKATPIIFGASCPGAQTCGQDIVKCGDWSEPVACGGPTSCTVLQYQTCIDSRGNECLNVAQAPASTDCSQ